MPTRTPNLRPLGEHALVASFSPPLRLSTQRRVWAVARSLSGEPGLIEVVPGMNNLTAFYDPALLDPDALGNRLLALFEQAAEAPAAEEGGQLIEVPVRYGGTHGPDLARVAAHSGLSETEIIKRHAAGRYTVYFLGFLPGFAYLGGLDPALATPRLETPRLTVPAGAVGIAGEQTGIYPQASPGGWNLIGQTQLRLFNAERSPPALLAPGDQVRFVAQETPA